MDFLANLQNWDNHRPFLLKAIRLMESPVQIYECGIGHGSSPYLHYLARTNEGLKIVAFETDKQWADKFEELNSKRYNINLVNNWDSVDVCKADVILIDHAPGERRKVDIARYRENGKGILVAHDTEPDADHGYQMRDELKKFKYMIDYKSNGAWATAVSNYYDVTKWNEAGSDL